MAEKKNENIVIVDKELTPTIIGKLDKSEKSPVLLIIIFIIFIAVAIFMPDITNYIEAYLNGNNTNITNKPAVNEPEDVDKEQLPNEQENPVYYDYTEDLAINHESFTMSNIIISENKIYFDLKNNTDAVLDMKEKKQFLEIYSSDNTLLQRIKISFGTIDVSSVKNYEYVLDDNVSGNVSKLLISTKTEADYPEVNLTLNEDGKGILVCENKYEKITYTFGNSMLISINDVINYPFENTIAYSELLKNYQLNAATYNNYDGVSATLINNETGFTFNALLDLQNVDLTNIENNYYYNYKTNVKTVKFEMESNGFNCN